MMNDRKTCPVCDKVFLRPKRRDRVKEFISITKWARRVYCSSQCLHAAGWNAAKDHQLRQIWPHNSCQTVADAMGITATRVRTRARNLGLAMPRASKFRQPDKDIWIAAVKTQAMAANISTKDILQGARKHPIAVARWKAFKAVLDENPTVSIFGLARVAGFDHTTILHGLARLKGMSPDVSRTGGRATGRRPANLLMRAA